jgi:hypothetical protein
MTQSKDDDYTITLDSGEKLDLSGILDTTGDITINLDNTMGTTTTYWAGDSVADVVYSGSNDSTFTIDINDLTTDTIDIDWLTGKLNIDPDEVEHMCKEYPALERVWRNFKSVYDMVKQDYEGKKKAGEIDDDIPF